MTKIEIAQKIDNIIKENGNIKAVQTNEILKDILDYTDNTFEIFPNKIIDTGATKYFYSFKGIKNYSCSLYFVFHKAKENGENVIKIELTEEEYALLSSFIPLYTYSKEERNFDFLTFQIPVMLNEKVNEASLTIVLINEITETKKHYVSIGISIDSNLLISTSISLNYKKNNIVNEIFLNIFQNNKNTSFKPTGGMKNIFDVLSKNDIE